METGKLGHEIEKFVNYFGWGGEFVVNCELRCKNTTRALNYLALILLSFDALIRFFKVCAICCL